MSEPQINPYGAVDLAALAASKNPPAENADAREKGVVLDVTEAEFEQLVQLSNTVPILIDLWSPRAEHSKELSPLLEKLALENDGAFLHAKVDVDSSPQIAQAFQVQAIPTVVALIQGRPLPLFQGSVPEDQLRQVIQEVLKVAQQQGVTGKVPGTGEEQPQPEPEEELPPLHQEAYDAIEREDLAGAAAAYQKALDENPGDDMARLGLAQVHLLQRTRGVDLNAARAAAAADPADLDAQLLVADLDVLGGAIEDGFLRILEVIKTTAGSERDRAREHLLELFEVVGPDDARVIKARRDLTSALF